MASASLPAHPLEPYYHFFSLMHLVHDGRISNDLEPLGTLPDELHRVLERINSGFTTPLTISALAAEAHISVNTLERYFRQHLFTSPKAYIRQKRLSFAAQLLQSQLSVSQAAEQSGFSDVSVFISAFRKQFGVTPLAYKKHRS